MVVECIYCKLICQQRQGLEITLTDVIQTIVIAKMAIND